MLDRSEFSEWKSAGDVDAMKRDVQSLQDLIRRDSGVLDEEKRRRALSRFTATSVPSAEISDEDGGG